jgi:hypothetical protein
MYLYFNIRVKKGNIGILGEQEGEGRYYRLDNMIE